MSASFLALSALYQKKHKDYIDNCCKAVEGLKGDHQNSAAWKLIDTITGRKSRPEGLIKAILLQRELKNGKHILEIFFQVPNSTQI